MLMMVKFVDYDFCKLSSSVKLKICNKKKFEWKNLKVQSSYLCTEKLSWTKTFSYFHKSQKIKIKYHHRDRNRTLSNMFGSLTSYT